MDRIAGFVSTMPSMAARERAAIDRYLAAPPGTPPEGRRVYVLYCSGCHGADGEGQGFYSDAVARRMQPAALAAPRIAAATDVELAERIGMGGAHAAEAATMPGWINTLSPPERHALFGYLRGLASEGTAR
jgi:mono/diheme cytochrome c family protein